MKKSENYSPTLYAVASKEKPCQLCTSVPDFAAHKRSMLNKREYCIQHFHKESKRRGKLGVLISNSNVRLKIYMNSNCSRTSIANSDNPGPTV